MKHYGDITKIHGDAVEIVDIITGGSPCQDLSVAGKRDGLAGERSGLFMEQVRIVKEMRAHDVRTNGRAGQFIRPRYMVWENVPGAFSSNGGKDFQAVLTEIARIAEPECPDVPMPEKNKWRKSGCIYDGMGQWSIAWRVHDAQFWGVPQRRKRIALVADFGGLTAPEILFERKGLSRDSEQGEEERQGTSADAERSTGTAISFQERAGCAGGGKGILIQNEHTGALSTLNNQSVCCGIDVYNQDITGDTAASVTAAAGGSNTTGPKVMCLNDMGGRQMAVSEDKTASLRAEAHWHQPLVYGICSFDSNAMKSQNPNSGIYKADTARTLDLNGGSPACNQGGMVVLMDAFQHHGYRESDTCGTLTAEQNQGIRGDTPIVLEGNGARESHKGSGFTKSETMYTLNTIEQHAVCAGFKAGQSMAGGIGWAEEQAATLSADCSGTEPTVFDARGNGNGDCCPTITGDHQNRVTDYTALCIGNGQMCNMSMAPVANSLDCMHDQQAVYIPDVGHALKGKANLQFREDSETYVTSVNFRNNTESEEVNGTLQSKATGGWNCNSNMICRLGPVARRLTPLECERLQGYPDGWTDIGEWVDSKGKRHKDADSPRYKALGNSIALPFWAWMARRICAQYERPMTMASLFDGLGGFPLVFSRAGCRPVWASEIEEFPIAVTKRRFGE